MTSISSIGSSTSTSSSYISPLDKNGDGVVDAQELQDAAQSGLLSASVLGDEDDSDPSATDKFSGSLASMLLQMQQSSSQSDSSSSTGSSDQSGIDALFANMDTDGNGSVSSAEFVAGRPADMSESDAETLFKSLDTQGSGSVSKDQLAEGLKSLSSTDSSASDVLSLASSYTDSSSSASASSSTGNALEDFIAELEASMTAYQNTYGQYDSDDSDLLTA